MTDDVLPNELRCSYPFKFCSNRCAVKKSGARHKLCVEHREKAKRDQRSLLRRRTQFQAQVWGSSDGSAPSTQSSDRQLSFLDISDLLDNDTSLHVECKEDDLKAVEALLSD